MFEGLEIKVPLYIGATLPLSPVQNKLYFLRLLVGSKKTWQHPGLNLFNSPHPSPASPWNLCSDKALSFLGITYIFFFSISMQGLLSSKSLVPLSITNSDALSQWSEVNYEGHSFFVDIIGPVHLFILSLRLYCVPTVCHVLSHELGRQK